MQGESLRALFDPLGPGGGSKVMPVPREDLGGDMLVPALAKHEGRRPRPKPFLPEKLWFFKIQRLERRLKQALKTGPGYKAHPQELPSLLPLLISEASCRRASCASNGIAPAPRPSAEGSTC